MILLAHFEAILFFNSSEFILVHDNLIMVMLLWPSKFATAKIEYSFEIGK